MSLPEPLIESGQADEGREYKIAFVDETYVPDEYVGERHECRWHVWDSDGAKLDGEFPDSMIIVVDRC